MFTGIIEEVGRVVRLTRGRGATRLSLAAPRVGRGLRRGQSLAVNGACLTMVGKRGGQLQFDLLDETLRCTNLGQLAAGDLVNLERPLRADARLDGHFVLGHVDATGTIKRYGRQGTDYLLEIAAPRAVMRYVLYKGSIAVDGISLTIARARAASFSLCIIPHTHAATNLHTRRAGERVNLEVDILGKYAEKLLGRRRG